MHVYCCKKFIVCSNIFLVGLETLCHLPTLSIRWSHPWFNQDCLYLPLPSETFVMLSDIFLVVQEPCATYSLWLLQRSLLGLLFSMTAYISSFWLIVVSCKFSSSLSECLDKSGGSNTPDWFTLGTRKIRLRVANLNKFLISTASHKFLKSVLVTWNKWRTMPPPVFDVKLPRLSMHMRSAKKVPSMPRGHNLVLRTIIGIHLILPEILMQDSSRITKK